jgi:spore coat protein CotH
VSPADVRTYPDAPLYDAATLRTFFLQFESPDWESELEAFYGSDVDVPAAVTVDGRSYADVGIHFRGNSSFRMVPAGSKRSLNLAFDFASKTQEMGGYRTLNFLNANGDPTFLRTVLYSEIARRYIPAPKTNFVKVVINGESWGLYVSAEQINKDFLREEFGNSAGARWKVPGSPGGRGGLEYLGDDVETYKRVYEIKTKDDPRAWADLIRFCRTLSQTPTERLEAALKPMLDIDGALKFLALEIVLHNSDGYWIRASDYAIYEDPDGRFHLMPHDFNEGFNAIEGRGYRGDEAELDPLIGLTDASKPLRSRLLAVPALRQRYLALVREMAGKWLDWKTLGPIATRYRNLIGADVKADTGKLYTFEQFLEGFGDGQNPAPATTLKGFAERRRAFLLKQ